MNTIAQIQDKKEAEILNKYKSAGQPEHDQIREAHAARVLQRSYRGHKERRQLRGLSLDPTTRWTEAVKEAQYRSYTAPRPRSSAANSAAQDGLQRSDTSARQNWSRIGIIARRAGGDEESSLSSSDNDNATSTQKDVRERKRLADKQERTKSAMMMDLSYFLEMVDVKHRYGSNLRKYHAEWKSRPTKENFFYWLDQGEGKDIEVEKCSRERLENMQVRYLGREERRYYEVIVDEEGKLCWRKDGVRVDTSDQWRDSIHGIVKLDDPTPVWAHRPAMLRGSSESSGMSSEEDSGHISQTSSKTEKNSNEKPPQNTSAQTSPTSPKDAHPNRHSSFHNLLQRSPGNKKTKKKKQKWIFVADTNNNLYIGIKQSGAFQHSSFLHGSRVSAAGLITVDNGKLRILQPRSGHYRTPSHNLHIFIKSLQARNVDMPVMAVGNTYVSMVGIEGFMKTRGKFREVKSGIKSTLSSGRDSSGGAGEKDGK